MRTRSIFASTKVGVSETIDGGVEAIKFGKDIIQYGRAELKATAKLSNLENKEEYVSTKIQLLRGMYEQLASVQALPDSEAKTFEVELIKASIKTIQEEA